ncbi:hypothetical protein HP548_31250 [Paenibacillus taichungensis]|uniref:Uncharacterized protein n=1 Tax=Paenibacillus taichungensis TaxID=484184 RepID=A0ABX2MWX3_9BACL|nr:MULTISPECIES: hypothetical protein [Paenibacillus]NUU58561.1 hypothetical protein [Paenibacillus taichungensis]PIH60004.1 hypothetical protein CS562_08745 [Paenibacillus sp. LK1]
MKRIMKFSIIPIVLIILILLFYQFPKKIDIIRPAVSFNDNNPESLKNTSIHIAGTFNRPLFRQHVFKGSIIINGIEITEKYDTIDTEVLKRMNGINMGNLIYNNTQNATVLGIIWFDNNFRDIGILGVNTEANQKEAIYIVTGESYEEGLNNLKKMRDKYGSGFINFE